ncbi:hydrogenase subunit MbhD domain-containing protein [Streptosporangium amethystogenes]|uniref:hydrogenase subunit MbhD domain-containing protein n=1 Tax=Streptosporangium amethystogenes TaxID=2002 RepID=UPI0037B53CBA
MSEVLVLVALTLVTVAGTAVVRTTAPDCQALTLSIFGLTLTLLFVVLQAPDVALSQLAIGTALVPLMVMLTIRRTGGGGR